MYQNKKSLTQIELKNLKPKKPYNFNKKERIKKCIKEEGFKYLCDDDYIEITNDNIILNGHHRYQSLIELYGGEFNIIVKKHSYNYLKLKIINVYLRLLLLIIIIFLIDFFL